MRMYLGSANNKCTVSEIEAMQAIQSIFTHSVFPSFRLEATFRRGPTDGQLFGARFCPQGLKNYPQGKKKC